MRFNKNNNIIVHVARASRPCLISSSILACSLFVGCQSAQVPHPTDAKLLASTPDSQMDFWHDLANRPLASNNDAFHALLLYLDGKDDSASYAARVSTLRSRNLLPKDFAGTENQAVTRGTLSTPFVEILHLKGGVNMAIFGPTPRYATRLLQYKGIYPESSPNQALSGADLVGLIGKLEDEQRGGYDYPAAFLPGEVHALGSPIHENDLASLSDNFKDSLVPDIDFSEPVNLQITTNPSTAPASTQSAAAAVTDVIVDGVEGKFAQVRTAPDAAWQPAVVGQKYGVNAEFRTGPKSAIRFVIPPDQTFTLDRVSTLKVSEISVQGKKVTTNVDMKYGRVRYDLEPITQDNRGQDRNTYQVSETGIEHASTIRSPNSTLAVRGTRVSMMDQPPFAPVATSLVGRAEFRNARRQLVTFGTKTTRTNKVNADEDSAAETALLATVIDPTHPLARTSQDAPLVQNLISTGAIVSFDRGSGLSIVRGGSPPSDEKLVTLLPGAYNFVLRWNTDTNLDLAVAGQGRNGEGEFVYPSAGLISTKSGGKTKFDHRGGPNGGIEVVFWKGTPPSGIYSVGVSHVSGAPADAKVNVFYNGQPVPIHPDGDITSPGVNSTTVKVDKGQTAAAGVVNVGLQTPTDPGARVKKRPAKSDR